MGVCTGYSPTTHWPKAQDLCDGPGSETSFWKGSSHCTPDENIDTHKRHLGVQVTQKRSILSLHLSAPGRTVPSHRQHRTNGGLSFHSTFQLHGCRSMDFLSGNVLGYCCCQCRSLPERYEWRVLHSLHGYATPAKVTVAWVCQRRIMPVLCDCLFKYNLAFL